MKIFTPRKSRRSPGSAWLENLAFPTALLFLYFCLPATRLPGQSVLFDFDNAPPMTSLPIDQTVGGITAHFSATGQGYSIQEANVLGFVPQGFAGRIIYPNSVFLADLLIRFDQTLKDFSIMYSCQELGCDDAATMRVTAFMNGSLVGTNTMTAQFPGTWPVDTLRCTFLQGFDSVVVHYDSHPPICQDYGVIYLADNMRVTALNGVAVAHPAALLGVSLAPNPMAQRAVLTLDLQEAATVKISLRDMTGRWVQDFFTGPLDIGPQKVTCTLENAAFENGVYFLQIESELFRKFYKVLIIR